VYHRLNQSLAYPEFLRVPVDERFVLGRVSGISAQHGPGAGSAVSDVELVFVAGGDIGEMVNPACIYHDIDPGYSRNRQEEKSCNNDGKNQSLCAVLLNVGVFIHFSFDGTESKLYFAHKYTQLSAFVNMEWRGFYMEHSFLRLIENFFTLFYHISIVGIA
jgi:hypothetical protein